MSSDGPRDRAAANADILIPLEFDDGACATDGAVRATLPLNKKTTDEDALVTSRAQRRMLIGWKVLPARLALSLRLERLQPSRPPRWLRAPAKALPSCSMCRLRLSVAGLSVRASHPSLILNPQSLFLEPTTIVKVRWNGHDDGVRSFSEWRIPSTNTAESNLVDFLLPVPEHNRDQLRLSLRVAVPSLACNLQAGKESVDKELQNGSVMGMIDIGWDGLSCLPVYRTEFFVEASDGRSVLHPSLPILAELVAVQGACRHFNLATPSVGDLSTTTSHLSQTSNDDVSVNEEGLLGENTIRM